MKRLSNRKFALILVALGILTIAMFRGVDVTSSLVSIILAVIGL